MKTILWRSLRVDEAQAKGKAVVIVNPNLKDKQSSGGVMGVRGRKDRLEFAETFETCAHFRLLYTAGTNFPIMGALRYSYGGKWGVYDRVDFKVDLPDGTKRRMERYELIGEFDHEPMGGEITECFRPQMRF